MTEKDPTYERIRSAFRDFCRADAAAGREQLEAIWAELQPDGDAFHRALTAHYLADTEHELENELAWDLKALEAAESHSIEDDRTAAAVTTFFPSLHMNLADDYRKMGDFEAARKHIEKGHELSGVLGFDAYGQSVRESLLRVESQIGEQDSGPPIVFDYD